MEEDYESKVKQVEATYDYLKDEVHILYEENKELKQKYNLMKENAETLAKRIDKAIEYIYESAYDEDRKMQVDDMWEEIPKLLEILKGEDKKATVELIDDKGNKKEVNFKTIELKYGEYLKKIDGKWYVYKNKGEDKE